MDQTERSCTKSCLLRVASIEEGLDQYHFEVPGKQDGTTKEEV